MHTYNKPVDVGFQAHYIYSAVLPPALDSISVELSVSRLSRLDHLAVVRQYYKLRIASPEEVQQFEHFSMYRKTRENE